MLNKNHPEIQSIRDELFDINGRVAKIEAYQDECEQLHKKIEEHSKRRDDAIKYNTESNIFLTRSVNDLNVTITQTFSDLNNSINQLTTKVDSHEPVVMELRNFGTALSVNKKILMTAGAVAGAILAIVAAYNHFF